MRKLNNLIKKARALRIQIQNNFVGDAGLYLSEYILDTTKEKKEFNRVMDEIAKIDPNEPTFRYEV